jgi:hypothetical protein
MVHAHTHDDDTHQLEQICTIFVCAAIGLVTIRLAQRNLLFFLADFLHVWIYAGGIALVVLSAILAVPLIISAFAKRKASALTSASTAHDHGHTHDHDHGACEHDHNHDHHHGHEHEGEECSHDHEHSHAHGHSHEGHEHGWAPWRYVVLLLPVVLYFLDMPSQGFSVGTDNTQISGEGTKAEAKGGDVISGFLELERAAFTDQSRKDYAGRTALVVGQVAPSGDRSRFTLIRYRMACCAADATPLKMIVEVGNDDEAGKTFNARTIQSKWVEIQGVIQFRKLLNDEGYITILQIKAAEIKQVGQPASPFVY